MMKTGVFYVYGDIGNISERIFKKMKETVVREEATIGENAIEEAGGIPIGIRIENNLLTFDEKTSLLRSRVRFEIK